MVHLDYRDARPIYTQIVDGLHQQIAAGVLQPGDRLPSVRELASQLTINPNTIQRAYRELEAAGVIATVAGKGCFVCEMTQPDPRQALLQTFRETAQSLLALGVTQQELLDILEGGNNHA